MPWRSAIVCRLDLAARQMHLQELVHLLQLEVVIGDELDLSLVAVDRGFAALEIEAGRDLALDRGDRIIDLSEIDAGNDVKARHWSVLRGSGFGRDIAREPLDLQRRYPGGQRRSGRPATKTGGSMMRFIKALTRS